VATGLLEYAAVLCAAGAVRRLESAFAGNTYPAPAPSRQLGEAIDGAPGSDPDWTNLTMTLRLMAGAMGWPFVPTASLAGSDLWDGPGRAEVKNPFADGTASVIAPLRPDVAFLHVPVADTLGNAVVHPPDAEESWGVLAAKRVVVTAERVVSPEALRRLGPRAGVPGSQVDFVVEAPFGAHPQGQFVWAKEEGVASYAEDYEARLQLRKLSRDPKALRTWVEEWVFATDHAGYLARLGEARLARLRAEAEAPAAIAAPPPDGPPSPEERAAVLAMRFARAEVVAGRARSLFAGIGLAHLAAWGAERWCRADGVPVNLVAETGMVGFRPRAGDPYLFSRPNAAAALFHTSFVRTLGALAGPGAKGCLALLAAGQIDRRGNVNSSRSADGRLIVGSGGANDLGSGGAACLVVMPLKPGRFAAELPFTTTPIRKLAGVATDLGLLGRDGRSGELRIEAVTCDPGREPETVAEIRRRAGLDLPIAEGLVREDPPHERELAVLRSFDPQRQLLA
jgi:acyl CoA:acetate/3-ketoacid CoA transferase alpha subunit/acyl CoA:acetate/3-ketoacid CoA transferase beta subunit